MNVLQGDTGVRASPLSSSWGTATDGTAWTLGSGSSANISTTTAELQSNTATVYMTLGASNALDCVAIVRALINHSGDSPGILLRYTSALTHIKLDVSSGTLRIRKAIAGTFSNVATASVTVNTGGFYWYKFQVAGTTYKAKIWHDNVAEPDWQALGVASDVTLATGSWGLIGEAGTASQLQFDRFNVFDLSTTSPLLAFQGNRHRVGRVG